MPMMSKERLDEALMVMGKVELQRRQHKGWWSGGRSDIGIVSRF